MFPLITALKLYLFTVFSFKYAVFFLDLPPFLLQLKGPQETRQSVRQKAKEKDSDSSNWKADE